MPEDCLRQLVGPHIGGRTFRHLGELQVDSGAQAGRRTFPWQTSGAQAEQRPSPEALLAEANGDEGKSRTGRLKIFVGAAPGVGKTYEMLQAAQLREARGGRCSGRAGGDARPA